MARIFDRIGGASLASILSLAQMSAKARHIRTKSWFESLAFALRLATMVFNAAFGSDCERRHGEGWRMTRSRVWFTLARKGNYFNLNGEHSANRCQQRPKAEAHCQAQR